MTPAEATRRLSSIVGEHHDVVGPLAGGATGATAIRRNDGVRFVIKWESDSQLFCEKGYAQTSVADLVEASGVHKSSLYSTFGAKEELFARILRRYFEERRSSFGSMVEGVGPGVDGIHTFFDMLLDDLVSGSTAHKGCLMVTSSSELNGSGPISS